MITQVSKKVTSRFIMLGIIPEDGFEVYAYSFEILISSLISFLALSVAAILSGTVYYTALYLVGFMPIRLSAGGFHACGGR